MKELITIKELADRLNISKAQAYQEIKKEKYKSFIVYEDGMKKIDTAVFDVPGEKKPEAEKHIDSPDNGTGDFIEYLKRQVEEKDRIIAEKDKQIAEMNIRLSSLLETQQDIARKALNATEQANYITAIHALPEGKKSFWDRFKRHRKESEEDV